MAKPENIGAFTIRTPRDPGDRRDFLEMVQHMLDEIRDNRATGRGPKSKAAMFTTMAKERYPEEIERKERDVQRNKRDNRIASPSAKPSPF